MEVTVRIGAVLATGVVGVDERMKSEDGRAAGRVPLPNADNSIELSVSASKLLSTLRPSPSASDSAILAFVLS